MNTSIDLAVEREGQQDHVSEAAPALLAALKQLVDNSAFELGIPTVEGRPSKRRDRAVAAWNKAVVDAHAAIRLAQTGERT